VTVTGIVVDGRVVGGVDDLQEEKRMQNAEFRMQNERKTTLFRVPPIPF
jgi:hypothetical protein